MTGAGVDGGAMTGAGVDGIEGAVISGGGGIPVAGLDSGVL